MSDELQHYRKLADEAIRRKDFCEQWYAERFQAIHAYGKEAGEPLYSDLCSLMANGMTM